MEYTLRNTIVDIDDNLRQVRLVTVEGRELLTLAMSDQRVLFSGGGVNVPQARALLIAHLEDHGRLDALGGGDLYSDGWQEFMTDRRNILVEQAEHLQHIGDNPFFREEEILLLAKWEKQLRRIAHDMETQLRLPEYA